MRFIDVDTALSEFSQDELRDAALAISAYIDDLQKHIRTVEQYALQNMFGDKILEYSVRIDNLQTVLTQLINASARKTIQRQIASN